MAAVQDDFEESSDISLDEESISENLEVDVELGEASLDEEEQDVLNPVNSDETPIASNRPRLTRDFAQSRWGISQAKLLRKATTLNLSTGEKGGKEMLVEERTTHQDAMNPTERMLDQLFGKHTEEESMVASPKQYRLTARPTSRRRTIMEFLTGTRSDCDEYDCTVGAKAGYLTSYLRWTFRTSFPALLLFSCACFMIFSCLFAIAIHIVGIYQPKCINVYGHDYNKAGRHFIDAFTLSWTTFSTVGYGHIYPNLAFAGGRRCLWVNFFCTFESFCGVLFGGFMCAIIVGKMSRVQSFAPTTFSDPIVVRYGTGLVRQEVSDDHTEESASTKSMDSRGFPKEKLPCPMLEFRVVNRMHSVGGGEIMNCSLNVVASVLESKASKYLQESVLHKSHRGRRRRKGGLGVTAGGFVTGTAKQVGSVATDTANLVGTVAANTAKQVGKATGTAKIASETAKQVGNVAGAVTSGVSTVAETVGTQAVNVADVVASGVSTVAETVGTQAVKVTSILKAPLVREESSGEPSQNSIHAKSAFAASLSEASRTQRSTSALVDEGSDLAPRRIFSNLEVETPTHPFFKRVWNVRHVLDQNSPLLSTKAREMIINNNGFWPEELNSYQAIRDNLHFHEIIVNLSGTCNATGNVVYCQKVYSYVDVNIGYAFVRVLHRCEDGRLSVDVSLLNDVVEQSGGGGEPFMHVHDTDLFKEAIGAAERVATTAQNVAGRTQEHIAGTTQNVADRTREKVVQFKEATTDIYDKVAATGDSDGEESLGMESPQSSPVKGTKKTV